MERITHKVGLVMAIGLGMWFGDILTYETSSEMTTTITLFLVLICATVLTMMGA